MTKEKLIKIRRKNQLKLQRTKNRAFKWLEWQNEIRIKRAKRRIKNRILKETKKGANGFLYETKNMFDKNSDVWRIAINELNDEYKGIFSYEVIFEKYKIWVNITGKYKVKELKGFDN